jgi:hypothetical protein
MKQRDITPYNILKKIVPARKMVGKITRVKIKMVMQTLTVLILFMAELCSKTCGLGRKNLSNSKTFNHPQKIVCYKLTLGE